MSKEFSKVVDATRERQTSYCLNNSKGIVEYSIEQIGRLKVLNTAPSPIPQHTTACPRDLSPLALSLFLLSCLLLCLFCVCLLWVHVNYLATGFSIPRMIFPDVCHNSCDISNISTITSKKWLLECFHLREWGRGRARNLEFNGAASSQLNTPANSYIQTCECTPCTHRWSLGITHGETKTAHISVREMPFQQR